MRIAAFIFIDLVPFVLAGWWPFARVVRGKGVAGSFFLCWGLLVFWHIVLFLVLPVLLFRCLGFDLSDWVPEGPAIGVTTVILGWFPVAVTVLVADGVRHFASNPKSSGGP